MAQPGANKEFCKAYKAAGTEERNKKRNVARAKRQTGKAQLKAQKRIATGKPVRSKHIAASKGTSQGKVILLGADATFASCDQYVMRHGLEAKSEKVRVAPDVVDPDGNVARSGSRYRLVGVRRKAA